MRLEEIYRKYYLMFSGKGMKEIRNKYVSTYVNSFFLLGMFFFILAPLLLTLGDNMKSENINYSGGFTISAIVLVILAFLYLKRHRIILNKNFKIFHNLPEEQSVDFIYYHLISELSKDKLFLEHRQDLIEFASVEIESDKTSYIQNPLLILSISFQMAIIVNKITAEGAVSGINLTYIVLIIFIFQFAYYVYYKSRTENSNHVEFKKFLLNTNLHEDIKKFDNKMQEPI